MVHSGFVTYIGGPHHSSACNSACSNRIVHGSTCSSHREAQNSKTYPTTRLAISKSTYTKEAPAPAPAPLPSSRTGGDGAGAVELPLLSLEDGEAAGDASGDAAGASGDAAGASGEAAGASGAAAGASGAAADASGAAAGAGVDSVREGALAGGVETGEAPATPATPDVPEVSDSESARQARIISCSIVSVLK